MGLTHLLKKLVGGDMLCCILSKLVHLYKNTVVSLTVQMRTKLQRMYVEAKYDPNIRASKMADLVKLYNNRLEELGVCSEIVHTTRLKNLILLQAPDLSAHTSAHSQGQAVNYIFDNDVADLIQQASE